MKKLFLLSILAVFSMAMFAQSNMSVNRLRVKDKITYMVAGREANSLTNATVGAINALVFDSSNVSAVTLDSGPDTLLTKSGSSMKYISKASLLGSVSGHAISLNPSSNYAVNINTGTSTGALTLGGGSGTVAVNSSDWDITTEGVATGLGNITSDGDIIATGGDITGANGNAIDIGEATDGTIVFSRDDAGTVTITSADNNADAALTVGAGGTGALTIGDVGSTTAVLSSGWGITSGGLMNQLKLPAPVANTDGTETLDATQSGVIVTAAYAGTTTITIPDPGATTVGVVYYLIQTANQTLTVTATTANGNSIVCDGVATSDNVSITTAGHLIGAGMVVIGISATQWYVGSLNPESLLTPEAAD
jgi:hypothetical protein